MPGVLAGAVRPPEALTPFAWPAPTPCTKRREGTGVPNTPRGCVKAQNQWKAGQDSSPNTGECNAHHLDNRQPCFQRQAGRNRVKHSNALNVHGQLNDVQPRGPGSSPAT